MELLWDVDSGRCADIGGLVALGGIWPVDGA